MVQNTIGILKAEGQSDFKMELFQDDWSIDVGKRRANFEGQHLNVFVGSDPPFTYLSPGRVQDSKHFDQEVGLYDVTSHSPTGGLYHNLFMELHRQLNFTFKFFSSTNQIISFGTVINNTATGTMRYLVNGSIDVLASSTSLTQPRSAIVQYLPIIGGKIPSIFIRNSMGKEVNWLTFTKPLSKQLWIAIIFVAIVMAACLFIANKGQSNKVKI